MYTWLLLRGRSITVIFVTRFSLKYLGTDKQMFPVLVAYEMDELEESDSTVITDDECSKITRLCAW
jgi:hypothetical protein